MPSRSYYLRQAEVLRAMASATTDEQMRRQQLARANEYVVLAMSFPEESYTGSAPPLSNPEQQPAAQQQQQQQVQPDDSEKDSEKKD